MNKVAVIGAGSWGTALALTLAKNKNKVFLYGRHPEQMEKMEKERRNSKYLPDAVFPESLNCTSDMKEAMEGAEYVVYAVPAQSFRSVLEKSKGYLDNDTIIINVAKGIELGTLKRMSEIAQEIIGDSKYVALSGPSHAEEVGLGLPTTVVVAGKNQDGSAENVQDLFINDKFRVYTQDDIVGVELAGALKNLIALGTGISDGIGFGDNAKAAIMTRGMAEITRLGLALGAEADTFAGLAGMGDLIVTCTSMHSRNRRCGIMIGEGKTPDEAVEAVGMVVEGMYTTQSAYELAQKVGVEMPITNQIHDVVTGIVKPRVAVDLLMNRHRKAE